MTLSHTIYFVRYKPISLSNELSDLYANLEAEYLKQLHNERPNRRTQILASEDEYEDKGKNKYQDNNYQDNYQDDYKDEEKDHYQDEYMEETSSENEAMYQDEGQQEDDENYDLEPEQT